MPKFINNVFFRKNKQSNFFKNGGSFEIEFLIITNIEFSFLLYQTKKIGNKICNREKIVFDQKLK